MKSLTPEFLANLKLSTSQTASLQALGHYQGRQELYFQQIPEVLERMRQVAIIESAESSNRLEGIAPAHDRIEAMILNNSTPQNRDEQEVAGYRDVLALIHESYKFMPFSVNVILQIHTMLYRHLMEEGGRWKPTDNEIIEKLPDGTRRVRFKAVAAAQTPQFMEDMVVLYQDRIRSHYGEQLILIPLVILDFLCIHPFRDGNGRTARLLTALLLYHFDFQVGRYISLERVIEETKESYYETLHKSSQGWHEGKHDVMPWLNYFWGIMIRAYKEFEERVSTIKPGKGSKTDQIINLVESKWKPFAISEIEAECQGIGRDHIKDVLKQLKDSGKIEQVGKGRGAKWIVKRN